MNSCLTAFNEATNKRESWNGSRASGLLHQLRNKPVAHLKALSEDDLKDIGQRQYTPTGLPNAEQVNKDAHKD